VDRLARYRQAEEVCGVNTHVLAVTRVSQWGRSGSFLGILKVEATMSTSDRAGLRSNIKSITFHGLSRLVQAYARSK
jgi:hypothetical protein